VSEYSLLVVNATQRPGGHFGDESFQAITCTGTDNSTQNKQNTQKKLVLLNN